MPEQPESATVTLSAKEYTAVAFLAAAGYNMLSGALSLSTARAFAVIGGFAQDECEAALLHLADELGLKKGAGMPPTTGIELPT